MSFEDVWVKFAGAISSFLPMSPFRDYLDAWKDLPYLGYLNWFIPVRACLIVFTAWLSALALYYLYSIILRWIKVIA